MFLAKRKKHCKEALTVKIVHWYLNKSQGLGAPGQNNTMVGRQKLSLKDTVFLDIFFSYKPLA
jgi:hypothetical protein